MELFTQDNGLVRIEMGRESKSGQMDPSMKENGRMIKPTVEVS